MLTGRTAAAAAVAADTGADTLPATVAGQVAGAAEAAGTERPWTTYRRRTGGVYILPTSLTVSIMIIFHVFFLYSV